MINKKLFIPIFAAVILFAGCSADLTEDVNMMGDTSEEITEIATRTLSLESAVYHKETDSWLVPQKDPYTLVNFQKAYESLATKKSVRTLTSSQMSEFTDVKRLEPTHYALRIFPQNKEEQWIIESMDDVKVAYIPFDYVPLTQEEVKKLPRQTTSAVNTFAEKSPYTVTYDYTVVTDGAPTGSQTFQLPILYTVWPVDKPLPEGMDYQMDYEVFLPPRDTDETVSVTSRNSLSKEAMQVLESEAITLALGGQATGFLLDPILTMMPVYGVVRTYDDVLGQTVPLANLKVRSQVGSSIQDTYSNSSGNFTAYARMSPSSYISVPLTFIYQDPAGKWEITTENSETTPYSVSVQVGFFRINSSSSDGYFGDCTLPKGERQANEIHRAVNYFYNNQIYFPKSSRPEPLTIMAHSNFNGAYNGYFSPPSFISIYNNSVGIFYSAIGTTLHEIGHAEHYQNNPNSFNETHNFLRESYASYVGWFLEQGYYKSLGWIHPGGNPGISLSNARQGWTKNTNGYSGWSHYGWYSPLFVDLTDDYNQSTVDSTLPYDEIKNVPPSVIWSIISTNTNWVQCRSKLQSYIGTYYTATEFNQWIADFDYWVANYY